MSTFDFTICKCSVCGKESKMLEIMSTCAFGSADLDTRPPDEKRSTMEAWVQECPECGYVSSEISDEPTIDVGYLQTEEYLSCDGIEFESELAKRFYKYYLINMKSEDGDSAFFASLCSAWASDDAGDIDNAILCRNNCLKLLDYCDDDEDSKSVYKADLLRRTNQFEEVIRLFENVTFEEEVLNYIIRFQVDRAKAKDNSCYTVEDTGFEFELYDDDDYDWDDEEYGDDEFDDEYDEEFESEDEYGYSEGMVDCCTDEYDYSVWLDHKYDGEYKGLYDVSEFEGEVEAGEVGGCDDDMDERDDED